MESVPEVVRQGALRAFDLRVPGAELADLVYDPLVDSGAPLPPTGERVLHFTTEDDSAVVRVSQTPNGIRLTLALVPAVPASVELRNTNDSWQLTTNDVGRLCVDSVPSGLVSLVIRREGARPIQTSWVRI
jgi:hypothetical protein